MLFKTTGRQPLDVKEANKLNDTIAQHHMVLIIIHQFMLLILSKDHTISRLGISELLVIASQCDLDLNFHASDHHDKFFMGRCVWSLDTHHPRKAF